MDEPPERARDARREPAPWSTRLAMVLWCSFLAACMGTMLAFAFLDPQAMHTGAAPHWWTTRLTVYGLGFFLFWLIAALASALTLFMACTGRRP